MPSSDYKNTKNYESPIKTSMRDNFRYPSQATASSQWEQYKRRTAENYNYLAAKSLRPSAGEKKQYDKQFGKEVKKTVDQEKRYRRELKRLQKKSPKAAVALAASRKSAIKAFLGGLFRQIDWSVDWLFILLASFGLLKDILDIAFAALGAVPVLGIAGAAVGIIISFVGDLLFLILVVTVLVLVGGSLKNRGMAKYFIGVAMEFIAEALPGISLLPWTVIYVFILYLCVLYDRMMNEGEREKVAA